MKTSDTCQSTKLILMMTFLSGLALFSLTTDAAEGPELPDGWSVVGDAPDAFTIEWTEAAGMDGRGIRIQSTDRAWRYRNWSHGDRYRFSGIGQWISAENYQGKRIKLTGYLRPQSVRGASGLWLRADVGGETRELDNMWRRPVRGTRGWREYKVEIRVPEDADVIAFGAHLSGEGQLDVDRLSFKAID